jgi:acetyl esterase
VPVDPELRRLLDYFSSRGLVVSEGTSLDLQQMRKGFLELSKLVPREAVASVRDFSVEYGDNVRVPCRLYTPKAEVGEGLTVFYHGGGFVLGGIEEYDGLCRALCNASQTKLLSVGYRLAPENRFPAAVEDAVAVLEYAAAHVGELGVKTDRLIVAGDSAGGNLATVAATLTRGKIKLKRQVLVYPAVSFDVSSYSHTEYSSGLFLTRAQLEWFGRQYLTKQADVLDPRFSPILFEDLRGLAPALIVTAEYDPLRDQGEAYAAKLAEQGVPVTRIRVGGMIHGFLSFFGVLKPARDTLNMIGAIINTDTRTES